MAGNSIGNPATHFGRQMRKERLAHGWSLHELARRTGINVGHLSRIENGKRPPTENLAAACDAAFPERRGWFSEYYEEMRTWSEVPAAFKDWSELEDKGATVRAWAPAVIHGLLQTQDYAAALLRTYPGVSEEAVNSRLTARMERQRRLFARDVLAWFIIDELSLYRLAGSAQVMAAQMCHLAGVAAMPNVTLQVLPAVANPGVTSGFVIADDATYAEHAASGFVYTGETVSALMRIFDSLRTEAYRGSESLRIIEGMAEAWAARGARAATAEPTAATAPRWPPLPA
jgi:transcriptional regulator with XRE-family HTH domain